MRASCVCAWPCAAQVHAPLAPAAADGGPSSTAAADALRAAVGAVCGAGPPPPPPPLPRQPATATNARGQDCSRSTLTALIKAAYSFALALSNRLQLCAKSPWAGGPDDPALFASTPLDAGTHSACAVVSLKNSKLRPVTPLSEPSSPASMAELFCRPLRVCPQTLLGYRIKAFLFVSFGGCSQQCRCSGRHLDTHSCRSPQIGQQLLSNAVHQTSVQTSVCGRVRSRTASSCSP